MANEDGHPGSRVESAAPRAAVVTPAGAGAIAVALVWGERALAVVDAVFLPSSGASLAATRPGRPRLGRLGREGLGDQVVVVVEGPCAVEIQCHGGCAAPRAVMRALAQAGAMAVESDLAVIQTAASAIQAQANLDLARAATLKSAQILLDQAAGALDREIAAIMELIGGDRAAALGRLKALAALGGLGTRLVRGFTVALAGRPNVGKSRLLNAIVGRERALVDPRPGTTRDVVTAAVALGGWPVELMDTAGERAGEGAIERAGIERGRAAREQADLVILVLDISTQLAPADRALIGEPGERLVVANKIDLPPAWPLAEAGAAVGVSATNGEGLGELASLIAGRLVPAPPAPGAALPFRASHIDAFKRVGERMRAGDAAGAGEILAALGHEG